MTNDANDRIMGRQLARRVANSHLHRELSDIEHAECDEILARGVPVDLAVI
ncbi:MAG: hypothetical protein KGL68_18055 [Burkholderiales bacterium]|nr:hypothetical protein [Burkholderiales bacterium]